MGSREKNIDRRKFMAATATMAAAGCATRKTETCPATPTSFAVTRKRPALADLTSGKQPNVLLVLTDQERWRGNLPPTLSRPNFERLRRNAVSFENSFCAYPLCSPSRSAILSGMFPHQSGITQNMIFPVGKKPLDNQAPHIGSVLASAGYRIAYRGKWDLSKGPTYYRINLSDRGTAGEYGYQGHCGKQPDQEYAYLADDQVVNSACQYIVEQGNNSPWFLTCSIINPHDICHPQLKPDGSIRPDVTLPMSLKDDLVNKPEDQRKRRDSKLSHFSTALNPKVKPFSEYEDRDWMLFLSFYYDLIELTDSYLGRLFRALEDAGSLDNTIIVYNSDHGELGGAHGFSGKYEAYEEDLHIPLYFHHPRLDPQEVAPLVSNVSIAPTIAALAGTEWPAPIPGKDLSPWLTGGTGPDDPAVFAESETRVNAGVYRRMMAMRMVRNRRYKYSYSFFNVRDGQLYDLEADPSEMNNLFHDSAHQAERREMEQMLRAWQKETGDYLELPAATD